MCPSIWSPYCFNPSSNCHPYLHSIHKVLTELDIFIISAKHRCTQYGPLVIHIEELNLTHGCTIIGKSKISIPYVNLPAALKKV
eukprot:gene15052-21978_t